MKPGLVKVTCYSTDFKNYMSVLSNSYKNLWQTLFDISFKSLLM